jgi:hypothetical protein
MYSRSVIPLSIRKIQETWLTGAMCGFEEAKAAPILQILGEMERPRKAWKSGERSDRADDRGDPDAGVGLTVPVATTHVLAATELLNDDLLVLEFLDDRGDNPGTFDHGGADDRSGALACDQENLGEHDLAAGLSVAAVDNDGVALANPELVATVLKNRVHPSKLLASGQVTGSPLPGESRQSVRSDRRPEIPATQWPRQGGKFQYVPDPGPGRKTTPAKNERPGTLQKRRELQNRENWP